VGILEFSAKSWIVKMENKEERRGGGWRRCSWRIRHGSGNGRVGLGGR